MMPETVNILMTSVGRRVSLMRAFRRAMADLGVEGRIVAADWSPLAPGLYEADAGHLVPGVNAPGYIDSLLAICRRESVGLVVPLIDWELQVLAEARARFADEGVRVLVSAPETVETCRDKAKTCACLASHGVGTPRVLTVAEARRGPFPVILKDRFGSSTRNVREVHSPGGLRSSRRKGVNYIIQEFVRGREFTVDVYSGLDGAPRVAVPRLRLQVRSGEVAKAQTVREPRVIAESMRLIEVLGGCVGVITAQCRLSEDGQVKFFDVNPRFGGGVPLAIRAGADFPRWLLEEHLGRRPEIDPEAWEGGLMMLRYDAEVFRSEADLVQPGEGAPAAGAAGEP